MPLPLIDDRSLPFLGLPHRGESAAFVKALGSAVKVDLKSETVCV